jgi:predicted site-specific integrase-resolvase
MTTTTRRILPSVLWMKREEPPTWKQELPTDYYVQIYPRVSSPEQKKNVSAEMQQDKGFALLCGWIEERIIMDTEDLGLSGQLRMEDRPAFVKMLRNIANGTVKVVIAAQVDRLFRDRWGQEYSKFMEICFTYGVKVVTPNPYRTGIDFVYDFSITWHVDKFRRKCEEAWNYIENHIGRMLAAREELALAGFWACGNLPVGYLVDRREKVDGVKNPLHRKYIVYKPHAAIVIWLFLRFRELAGQINELFREISRLDYLFPAFDESIDEELITRCRLKKVLDENGRIKGYTLASTLGLRSILSNPAYAGYWVYKGIVLKSDNHEAIVDIGTFLYAYNRISATNLDGTPNEFFIERQGQYVKKHNAERPALLKNHIRSGTEGFTLYCRTYPLQGSKTAGTAEVAYSFYPKTSGIRGTAFMVPTSEVDTIFLERFIYRLQHTECFEDFLTHESAAQAEQAQLQQDIERDIKAVKSILAKLKRRLTLLTAEDESEIETETDTENKDSDDEEKELVQEVRRAYRANKAELVRLEQRQKDATASYNQAQTRRTYKQLMHDAGEAWEEVVPPEEIPLMVDTFVKDVVLTVLSPRFYMITIHWYDPEWGTDERVCFKRGNPSVHWTREEDEILGLYYPYETREQLMQLLPMRSFLAIKNRASSLKIRRPNAQPESTPQTFCLRDLEFMERYGLTEDQLRGEEGAKLLTWSAS